MLNLWLEFDQSTFSLNVECQAETKGKEEMRKESIETATRMRWGIFGSSQEQKEANLPKIIGACAACFVFLPEHLGNENQKWWEENVGGNGLREKKEDYYCFFCHLPNTTNFISSNSSPFFLPLFLLGKCLQMIVSPLSGFSVTSQLSTLCEVIQMPKNSL